MAATHCCARTIDVLLGPRILFAAARLRYLIFLRYVQPLHPLPITVSTLSVFNCYPVEALQASPSSLASLDYSSISLTWTTSLEDENMASTLGMPVATATRAQAAAATTLEAVHRLDNEIIVPVLTSESLSLGLCKVCSAERLQARAK